MNIADLYYLLNIYLNNLVCHSFLLSPSLKSPYNVSKQISLVGSTCTQFTANKISIPLLYPASFILSVHLTYVLNTKSFRQEISMFSCKTGKNMRFSGKNISDILACFCPVRSINCDILACFMWQCCLLCIAGNTFTHSYSCSAMFAVKRCTCCEREYLIKVLVA